MCASLGEIVWLAQFNKQKNKITGADSMKKLFVLLSVLTLVVVAGAQNKNTSVKSKAAKTATDCAGVDDSKLTADVKERLSNTPSLKDFKIDVSVSGAVVTLTGSVKTGLNKGLASSQTKRVPCVKKVENKLTVEAKPEGNSNRKPKSKKTPNKNA